MSKAAFYSKGCNSVFCRVKTLSGALRIKQKGKAHRKPLSDTGYDLLYVQVRDQRLSAMPKQDVTAELHSTTHVNPHPALAYPPALLKQQGVQLLSKNGQYLQ